MKKSARDVLPKPSSAFSYAAALGFLLTTVSSPGFAQDQGIFPDEQEISSTQQEDIVELPPVEVSVQGTSLAAKKSRHKKKSKPAPSSQSNINVEGTGEPGGTASEGAIVGNAVATTGTNKSDGVNGRAGVPAKEVGSSVTVVTGE